MRVDFNFILIYVSFTLLICQFSTFFKYLFWYVKMFFNFLVLFLSLEDIL